jgi:hypothetical protein
MKISSFVLVAVCAAVLSVSFWAVASPYPGPASDAVSTEEWVSAGKLDGDLILAEQWISYWNSEGYWVWFVGPERATQFDPDQFPGVTVPLWIKRVRSQFYELLPQNPWGACTLFTYKIYADDGTTLLLESDTLTPVDRIGVTPTEWDLGPDSVEITTGTFWVSVSAVCDSHPSSHTDSVFQGYSFYGSPGSWNQYLLGELSMEAYVSWTALTHDVSLTSIIAPGFGAWVDTSHRVRARVENKGAGAEDFDVEFLILVPDTEYIDTVSITALEPESTRIVTFADWVPAIYDTTYTLNARTLLATDENPLNDEATSSTRTYEYGEIAYDDFEQDGWWAPTPPPNGPADAFAQKLTPYIAPPFAVTKFKIYVDSPQAFDNVRLCPALTPTSPDFDNPYQVINAPAASSPPEWVVVDFDTLLTTIATSDPIWLCAQFEDAAVGPSIGSDEDGPFNLNSYWTSNLTSWNLFAEDLFMRVVHKQTVPGVAEDFHFRRGGQTRFLQSVPNPFRMSTVIRFGIVTSTHVSLNVHDVAGKLVKNLQSGNVDSGVHSVVWDGKDNSGADAGAGVYFCRLDAGGSSRTVKMTLLR